MQYNVFIGRFQPVHNAHLEIIKGALYAKYDKSIYTEGNPNEVIICVGSAFRPRTPKDPFTAVEREQMIRSAFSTEENERIAIVPIADSLYNDTQWAQEIQNAVNGLVDNTTDYGPNTIRLVGHKKDTSSFYLDMFPQWKFVGISNIDDLHSTTIRDYYLNQKWVWPNDPIKEDGERDVDVFAEMCRDHLNAKVFEWMINFRKTEEYTLLQEEFSYIENYKDQWADAPYAPTFVTADAVVIQSGHIILVKRGQAPGKGLWALPGGFINPDELLEDAALRELREETKLKVPEPVLRGSIKHSRVFDFPGRSLRGRTITHAFHIELNPGPLPKIKGDDDADEALWIPISKALKMEACLFEDHASIIKYFIGA